MDAPTVRNRESFHVRFFVKLYRFALTGLPDFASRQADLFRGVNPPLQLIALILRRIVEGRLEGELVADLVGVENARPGTRRGLGHADSVHWRGSR